MSSDTDRYVKMTWRDDGKHEIEVVGIQKVSQVRKLIQHLMRAALKAAHAGKRLPGMEGPDGPASAA